MHKNKFLILSIILVAIGFLFSGCTKKVAEKTTEKIIEKNVGSEANVDLKNDQLTIETEQGVYQAGEQVSLPDGFPDDVYVIDGNIVAAMAMAEEQGYSVSVVTNKSVSEVKSEYEEKLKAADWNINLRMDYGESATLSATKANRTVSVSATASSDGTTVTIVTGNNL